MAEDDELRPVTQRVGGGRSAGLSAVVAIAALAGLVWVGLTGPPIPPAPAPLPTAAPAIVPAARAPSPSVAAAASPTPAASSPRRAGYRLSSPKPSEPRGPSEGGDDEDDRLAPSNDAFGAIWVINGRPYFNLLEEMEPDHLQATWHTRLDDEVTEGELHIVQLWSRTRPRNYVHLHTYQLRIGPLNGGSEVKQLVLDREVAPRRRSAPRLVRRGYALTVEVVDHGDGNRALLIVDVVLIPARPGVGSGARLTG